MRLPTWADERPSSAGQHRKRMAQRAGWLFLGLCGVFLVLTAAELLDMRLFSSVQRLFSTGSQPDDKPIRMSERDLLAMDYISPRHPPKGFEDWIRFAKQNQCHLGPYSRIEKDLQAFRGKGAGKGGITAGQLEAAKKLPRTIVFTVKNGRLSFSREGSARFSARFAGLMERFTKFLPDLEFVVNDLDEPRVLPGVEDSIDARYRSAQCKNASLDFRLFRHLHGSVNSRATGANYKPTKELVPIFSQTKINECYSDITYPTLYGIDNLLTPKQEREIPPWDERNASLYFRGATSGGHYTIETDFTMSHRQRLVQLAKDKPHMDIAFTDFLQCDINICKRMRAIYGQAEYMPQMNNFNYKYLMSIDGNTFVSRLPLFMSSGSLPFRSGFYNEWYDEWITEGVHYLRVKLDYSDLESKLRWAMTHDGEARLIGQQAREFAKRRLRNQDLECYLFRLLLEYATLLPLSR